MRSTSLSRALLLASLASVAASCSLVFGDFHVGESTSTGSGGGGSAPCQTADDCTKPSSSCVVAVCTTGVCSTANVNAGLTVPDSEQVPHDCKILVCDGNGAPTGKPDNSDLPDDDEICTIDICLGGVASHSPAVINLDCTGQGAAPNKVCGDPGTPGAGKCVECNTGAQCVSTVCKDNACLPGSCVDGAKNSTETDVDCGGGTCLDCTSGKKCVVAGDCVSAYCQGGVCQPCSADGHCSVTNYCKSGVCVPDLPVPLPCMANSQCQSNSCADGVCCDIACAGVCMACNLPGKVGACSVVPLGQLDPNEGCSGTAYCDGAGTCAHGSGYPCAINAECASSFCVDGVCCGNPCNNACQSCALPGTEGTCGLLPAGAEDPSSGAACSVHNACNAVGVCLLKNGEVCMISAECISNNCMNSLCQ